jgi:acetyl esterase/lipase
MGYLAQAWRLLAVSSMLSLGLAAPMLARAEPPPLATYGNLPGFEMAAISPSGDHIALVGNDGTSRKLIIFDKDLKPVLIASVGTVKVRNLHWAGDAMAMIETSVTAHLSELDFSADKAELTGMMVLPLNGGKLWAVFDHDPTITGGVDGYHGVIDRNGHWYGYFGGATMDGDQGSGAYLTSTHPVLYEVDMQSHSRRKIAARTDDEHGYRDWLIDNVGRLGATFDYQQGGHWSIRNSAGTTITSGTDRLAGVSLVGWGTAPGTVIYAVKDKPANVTRWFQLPLAGGEAKEILQDIGIHSTIFDNRSRALAGYEIEGDAPTYHMFDPHQQKVIAATQKAFPGLAMHVVDWNDRFDRLIVRTEGSGDPQTWWLVDIKTGHADPLGISYPMAGSAVAPTSMIHYKGAGDLDIAAVLTLPPGLPAKSLPVVVFPHGGPAARDYPGFDWWAQAFASRGYAVLQPNFRGSTGYGDAFQNAGNGEWGRKMQSDISDGLAELVKQGIADPKRACIMGASYGGYAALAGVTLQHGIYRCAVAIAGISDVRKMASSDMSDSGDDPTLTRALKVQIGSGRDLSAVSPIRFAASVEVPVLLIHGKDDTVVHYEQSTDMVHALKSASKVVEFVTLPGEDHWLSKSATRLTMLQASLDFVEKYNPADALVH